MSIRDFPEHVQHEVRRILDAEARRLLLAELEQTDDTIDTPAGRDPDDLKGMAR